MQARRALSNYKATGAAVCIVHTHRISSFLYSVSWGTNVPFRVPIAGGNPAQGKKLQRGQTGGWVRKWVPGEIVVLMLRLGLVCSNG